MAKAKVRVAIAGVGNCASSLIQALSYYRNAEGNAPVAGLMHPDLGGYRISDVEIVAAFDVAKGKVGRDVAEAIAAEPNNTAVFAEVAAMGVTVARGPTLDGIGRYLEGVVEEDPSRPVDVVDVLRESGADLLICYLPVGSEQGARFYAEAALEAGCGFINCIPVFLASDPDWQRRFEQKGLPIIGDDIKSQVGATILHRVLVNLFRTRGVQIDRTYQLNFGGNTDFLNMLERERLTSKKISKTQAVTSQFDLPLASSDVHVGPSDHVPWLKDRKWAHIRLEGTSFGGVPLSAEVKLEVWDSPNSAGVVIDTIRAMKLALDRGVGGALIAPSAYFMKSPPEQFTDDEARIGLERFIGGTGQAFLGAAE